MNPTNMYFCMVRKKDRCIYIIKNVIIMMNEIYLKKKVLFSLPFKV